MSAPDEIRSIVVFCGSSRKCDAQYLTAARQLGIHLAEARIRVIYGGGSVGLMGALAEGALGAGGEVVGIIPEFIVEMEWAHASLTDLQIVNDMHERKKRMLELSDAVVALPGGCGTLEELLEAVTLKQLGQYTGPIVVVNQEGFYDDLLAMLQTCINERFMNSHHDAIWQVADDASKVLDHISRSARRTHDSIHRAAVD